MRSMLSDIKKYERKIKSGKKLTRKETADLRKIRSTLRGINRTSRRVLYKKVKDAMKEASKVSKMNSVRSRSSSVVMKRCEDIDTDIDKMMVILQNKNKVCMKELAKKLKVEYKQVEKWGNMLEKKGIVIMEYPIFGSTRLRINKLHEDGSKKIDAYLKNFGH